MLQRLVDWPRCVSLQGRQIRWHLKCFADVIGSRSCVVDVGSGRLAPYKDLFSCETYVGIDPYELADVIGDARALPIMSQTADLILCTEVLEHLLVPWFALGEMRRVLTPEGFLIVTVPLIWGEHNHVDYQRWTEAGLRRMLDSAGLEVQIVKRRGGIFTMLGCMVTQVPRQVFGSLSEQRDWLLRVIYIVSWLIVAPIPWILAPLDFLDRTKAFTIGYSVLCRKK